MAPTHPPPHPEHPARLMSQFDVPVVVEVTHAPWTDSAIGGDRRHVQAVSNRLLADGIYVPALTLGITDGQVAAVGALLADTSPSRKSGFHLRAPTARFSLHPTPRLRWTGSSPFRARKDGPGDAGLPDRRQPRWRCAPRTRGGRDLVFPSKRTPEPSGISAATLERPRPAPGSHHRPLNSDTQPWGTEDSEAIAMVRNARMTWLSMLRHASWAIWSLPSVLQET